MSSIYDKYVQIKEAMSDGYDITGKRISVTGPLPGQPGWKPKGQGGPQPQPKPVNKNTVQPTQLKKAASLYNQILNY